MMRARSLFGRWSAKKPRRDRQSRRLFMEPLEDRRLLAILGDLTGGNFTLTGDAGANSLVIANVAGNVYTLTSATDNITITGDSGGNGAIRSENNSNTLTGVITMAGNAMIWVNDTQLTITNQIVGNQVLTKAGVGTLILRQDNQLSNFHLSGGEVRISTLGGLGSTTSISVDPKNDPKTIDNVHETGASKGKKQFGIYKLEGDKWIVCMTPPGAAESDRPKSFETKDT